VLDTLLPSGSDPSGLAAEFLLCRRSCADLDAQQLQALGFGGLNPNADRCATTRASAPAGRC